jgi:ribonuclease Z
MRVRIRPRLVNRKDGDPLLLIELEGSRDCLLFDCGSTDAIPKADILRISSIFVTHTHIDHFCGFDRILRNILGHVVTITIYGPPGITANVLGKLAGYTWNLIDEDGPVFVVRELAGSTVTVTTLKCQRGFRTEGTPVVEEIVDGAIFADDRFTVRFAVLDHMVPSLMYSIAERSYAGIRIDRVRELGLPEGPWLSELQEAALTGGAGDRSIEVGDRKLPLASLVEDLVRVKPGRKVTYVADTVYNDRVARTVSALGAGSDELFCEANFQEADADKAAAYFHLTARQAASLALAAGVHRLILFHVSRKYHGDIRSSLHEASEVFDRVE